MGAAIGLLSGVVSTGAGIYKNYNKMKRTESDNQLNYKNNIAKHQFSNSLSNTQLRQNISSLATDDLVATEQFNSSMRDFDYESSNIVASKRSDYLSSGVKLSGSATAVLNNLEDQIIYERTTRQNLADLDALKREEIADKLLYEININNILTAHNISQEKINLDYNLSKDNGSFYDNTLTSIISFGGKSMSSISSTGE